MYTLCQNTERSEEKRSLVHRHIWKFNLNEDTIISLSVWCCIDGLIKIIKRYYCIGWWHFTFQIADQTDIHLLLLFLLSSDIHDQIWISVHQSLKKIYHTTVGCPYSIFISFVKNIFFLLPQKKKRLKLLAHEQQFLKSSVLCWEILSLKLAVTYMYM